MTARSTEQRVLEALRDGREPETSAFVAWKVVHAELEAIDEARAGEVWSLVWTFLIAVEDDTDSVNNLDDAMTLAIHAVASTGDDCSPLEERYLAAVDALVDERVELGRRRRAAAAAAAAILGHWRADAGGITAGGIALPGAVRKEGRRLVGEGRRLEYQLEAWLRSRDNLNTVLEVLAGYGEDVTDEAYDASGSSLTFELAMRMQHRLVRHTTCQESDQIADHDRNVDVARGKWEATR